MGNFKRFVRNSYELNKNSKKGVLIIHGFSSSTYETLPLGEFLSDKGFRVSIPNLPGHGTTVEDCNEVKNQQNRVRTAIGLSMGAVLSLYAAGLFPINKVICCATVLNFRNPFVIHYMIPILNRIIVKQKKLTTAAKQANKRYSGYDYYPLTALNEFRKLNNYVKRRLNRVKCPILCVHSNADKLSIPSNVDLILDNTSSEIKEKLIVDYASHHLFYDSEDKDLIFKTIYNFINK